MGAAFVDIGLGRNAFLYVDDINKAPLNIGDVEITQGHSGFHDQREGQERRRHSRSDRRGAARPQRGADFDEHLAARAAI